MPTRILRDYRDSRRFRGISAGAERMFVRLLLAADDYGRFHADPELLRNTLFPWDASEVTPEAAAGWRDELAGRGLLRLYEAEGKPLLAILNFGQRIKPNTRPKFPHPRGESRHFLPGFTETSTPAGQSGSVPEHPGQSGTIRPHSESEAESYSKADAKAESEAHLAADAAASGTPSGSFPSLPEVKAEAERIMAPADCAVRWWNEQEGLGWLHRGQPIAHWRPLFRNYATSWKANLARGPGTKPGAPPPRDNNGQRASETPTDVDLAKVKRL